MSKIEPLASDVIHLPVTADGKTIRNSFGIVIAQCFDKLTADEMVRLINRAHKPR